MSASWMYQGHQDAETKIASIYCSKILQSFPPIFVWTIVFKDGTERPLGTYKETDFDHEEDKKAYNYAVENSSKLIDAELNKFYELSKQR